ncbi:MAG: YbjN domain-containing protein [Paracoccaceae bacterium]
MSFIRNLVATSVFLFPGMGIAQQIVATDGTSVAAFFEAEGVEPTIETDNVGDPKIEVDYYGSEFSIYYYGCDDGKNCDSIQFFSGYRTDGSVRLSKVNEWNADKRYGIAYISSTGSTRIEQDVYLGREGMNSDDFAKLVGIWVRTMKDFEEHIDW